jgi:catechol 2,3-dioxygenase-like lactoylglutathione lyase family enzyme
MNARVSAILAFRLTTQEPERLAQFYEGLGFSCGAISPIVAEETALLGLKGAGRRITLRLGEQQVSLESFDAPGRSYPAGSTSADLWFQHFAIVTDDASAQWMRAKALGARAISGDGAVTLPQSSGGVTAVKFRDPEGHPLEFLQFPKSADHGWKGKGLVGIDHSAITVSAARASVRFYESLGLAVQNSTLNNGFAQDVLDGLPHVEVDVIAMTPSTQLPHLELLGYRNPHSRSGAPLQANDVAATRVVWAADRDALIRDPDGHLHVLRKQGRSFSES